MGLSSLFRKLRLTDGAGGGWTRWVQAAYITGTKKIDARWAMLTKYL
jgi:hypothetical protein